MGRFKTRILLSFRTKLIVPVVFLTLLLTMVSMWVVENRMTQLTRNEAQKRLQAFDMLFADLQRSRMEDLKKRFRNIANEPRVKAVAGLPQEADVPLKPAGAVRQQKWIELQPKSANAGNQTLRKFLNDYLIGEQVADVLIIKSAGHPAVIVSGNPRFDENEFQVACADYISQAMDGQAKAGLLQIGGRLFDVVSQPIQGIADDQIIGSITFGIENTMADEFERATGCQMALLANRRIIASNREMNSEWQQQIMAEAPRWPEPEKGKPQFNPPLPAKDLPLGGKHFYVQYKQLPNTDDAHPVTYAILSSYEESWQALTATKWQFVLMSALAIFLATAVIWFFVHKVTEPLQELRDSVEAIGSGNFSKRVEVKTHDEFGELSEAFNQMTENLQHSRSELEATVERLKTTQAHLVQSEKLSGIGEFVAGVAHELNNPLTTVMGFSELMQRSEVSAEHRSFVEMIHKSAERCQKIVQALLSFARRHQPERKPFCVNKLIESSLEILQYQLRTSGIEIILRLDSKLPQAMVDSHQIEQVMVNIINNARQAIEAHSPKGWIKITTESAGPSVRITVQDSGPGISSDNLSKIFDPFFSTKEVGKGTGLGLSLCYGIIQEHGGTITPQSRRGEGATFVIELPITHQQDSAESTAAPAVKIAPISGVGRKVLVIDDEEAILHMVREVLTREGYEVDVAADGEAGLQRLRQTNYDVTLCDWKMPGLNGQQVYERMRIINPVSSSRVIFITGDLVSEKTRRFLETENKICLAKPFTLSEFREAIGKVLAS